MSEKPTPSRRRCKPQKIHAKNVVYPWEKLETVGWFFVLDLPGYADQGHSIRISGYNKGLKLAIYRAKDLDGNSGFLVEKA